MFAILLLYFCYVFDFIPAFEEPLVSPSQFLSKLLAVWPPACLVTAIHD